MVQHLIAALAAHGLPPELMAAVTTALVLGDQAVQAQHRHREQAAERQRRKRAADADASCHVTRHVMSRDKKEGLPHTPSKEKTNPTPKRGKPLFAPKGEKHAHPLPEDWSPEADDRAFAEAAGLDVEAETRCFVRYWRSHGDRPRARQRDWSEAWRYHCDRYGRRRPLPDRSPPKSYNPRAQQALEAMRVLHSTGAAA